MLQVSPPSGFTGGSAHVRTISQTVPYPSNGEFTTNELWIIDRYGYWVETGVISGVVQGFNIQGPHYFWAEDRISDGQFYMFVHAPYVLGQDSTMAIAMTGPQNSKVVYGGASSTSTGAVAYPVTAL